MAWPGFAISSGTSTSLTSASASPASWPRKKAAALRPASLRTSTAHGETARLPIQRYARRDSNPLQLCTVISVTASAVFSLFLLAFRVQAQIIQELLQLLLPSWSPRRPEATPSAPGDSERDNRRLRVLLRAPQFRHVTNSWTKAAAHPANNTAPPSRNWPRYLTRTPRIAGSPGAFAGGESRLDVRMAHGREHRAIPLLGWLWTTSPWSRRSARAPARSPPAAG